MKNIISYQPLLVARRRQFQAAVTSLLSVGAFIGMGFMLFNNLAYADSALLSPDSTVSNGWATGTYADIDEHPVLTADVVTTGTNGSDGEIARFGVDNLANVSSATALTLHYCAYSATNANGGTLDDVDAALRISGVDQTPTTATPPYNLNATNCTWYQVGYTGSWNSTAVDSIEMKFTRVRQGSGQPASQDDDVRIVVAYVDVTYTPTLTIGQEAYTFFENSTTSGSVGTALAAQDATAVAPPAGDPFRLRMLLSANSSSLSSGTAFKLQYKASTTSTCSATGAYTDVSATSPVRWYDNTSTSDGYTPLNSATGDPVRGGVTVVTQSYEEANNFTVATTIADGNDGRWDFALTLGSNHDPLSIYCLRAVKSDGSTLNTYSEVPAIQPQINGSYLTGQDYRWYENANSTTPGSPLAATDTAATLSSSGAAARLRVGIESLGFIKQISNGHDHTCAIASDDNAYCWGSDGAGQLGNDSNLTNKPTPVAVDTSGVLSGKTILSISAGGQHTCAVASDNNAYCWGDDSIYGQLGDDVTKADKSTPVAVDTSGALSGKTILSVSAGSYHTCVIASDNNAYCWGSDSNGQVGESADSLAKPTPIAVDTSGALSGKTVASITSGGFHTCAIASDNNAYCWGRDSEGQLGNDSNYTNQPTPVAVNTSGVLSGKTILDISVGYTHTCAVASDNNAYCWGDDSTYGQLGDNASLTNQPTPVAVDTSGVLSGKTIQSISVGLYHSCAIASDDNAYCWGYDSLSGQLGDDSSYANKATPVAVDTSGVLSGKTILSMSAGGSHTCSVASDRQAYCWGADSISGQLGDNASLTNQPTPVAVDNSGALASKTISSIASGGYHTCAIASDDNAYCWGKDDVDGQLGNNASLTSQPLPIPVDTSGVLSGKTIHSITNGGGHTCVIASDNKAYCWGDDAYGQLGDDVTYADKSTPVAVDTSGVLSGKTIKSISAGGHHTCVIASDDKAYCWGRDTYGALGDDSSYAHKPTPVAVDTSGVLSGKTILSITTGSYHTCVIASDNNAYCWGYDSNGQIGNDGGTTNQPTPVAVSTSGVLSGKTILSISAGVSHTCVIASDNNAYCWGQDIFGSVGDDSNFDLYRATPVAVDTSGVLSGKTISSIFSGGYANCVIASDNNTYCWGYDAYGQLGDDSTIDHKSTPVALDTSGVLSGKTLQSISLGYYHVCAVADDDNAYCWGYNDSGQLGNDEASSQEATPIAVVGFTKSITIKQNVINATLQYAQKTAGTCSAQTGFAVITTSTPIAYNGNASPSNGDAITSNANDPIAAAISSPQTYHEAVGAITNPSAIDGGEVGLWDFSLKDNSAPASTTYCLRLADGAGSSLNDYVYFPELTTAASGGGGPTLDQKTRGGSGVIDGVKQLFSW